MVRKFAFHMILAGHRFSKAGQVSIIFPDGKYQFSVFIWAACYYGKRCLASGVFMLVRCIELSNHKNDVCIDLLHLYFKVMLRITDLKFSDVFDFWVQLYTQIKKSYTILYEVASHEMFYNNVL